MYRFSVQRKFVTRFFATQDGFLSLDCNVVQFATEFPMMCNCRRAFHRSRLRNVFADIAEGAIGLTLKYASSGYRNAAVAPSVVTTTL
jgi:hypothetical protein